MRKICVLGLVLLLFAMSAACGNTDIFDRAKASQPATGDTNSYLNSERHLDIVGVSSTSQSSQNITIGSQSTGIIIYESAEFIYIATLNGFAGDDTDYTVSFAEGIEIPASALFNDPRYSMQLLSIPLTAVNSEKIDYRVANLADSSEVRVGDDVTAVSINTAHDETADFEIVFNHILRSYLSSNKINK